MDRHPGEESISDEDAVLLREVAGRRRSPVRSHLDGCGRTGLFRFGAPVARTLALRGAVIHANDSGRLLDPVSSRDQFEELPVLLDYFLPALRGGGFPDLEHSQLPNRSSVATSPGTQGADKFIRFVGCG
jgi:hypothetical protein